MDFQDVEDAEFLLNPYLAESKWSTTGVVKSVEYPNSEVLGVKHK